VQRLLADAAGKVKFASISPVSTAAANEAGLEVDAEATTYTWDGIFEAVIAAEECV
jgi:uroporphyrinogen III methyltransferase/synthase